MSAPWSEQEIQRALKRRATFMANGLSEEDSDRLIDTMVTRDRDPDLDDRRICYECKHFQPPMKCWARQAANPHVLQSCPEFQLKGSK